MDFNHYGNNNTNNYPNQPYGNPYPPAAGLRGRNLATASMVLGISALVTSVFLPIYLPCIFGSLAIVFALLSKGSAPRMQGAAKTGISCGASAFAITAALTAFSVYMVLTDPQFTDLMMDTAKTYDEIIEQMYGVPAEEILGESVEDRMREIMDSMQP